LTASRGGGSFLTPRELERHMEGWLLDGEIRQLSRRTLQERRILVGRLLWFLRQQEFESIGKPELRAYLAYLGRGHEQEGGRWGDPRRTKPLRPRTVATHYVNLKVFFRWLVAEGAIELSPMEELPPPVARADQIQPFTDDQVSALLAAARRSRNRYRDEAILLVLLATGMRASELCGLTRANLDLGGRSCNVLGKGNKRRTLPLGRNATRALWSYLRAEERDPDEPVFMAEGNGAAGNAMTRSGLLQLFERLGKAAGLSAVRCSPHTMRHTFAVSFLRAGGNAFTLQQLLGHTDLQMTRRYVALAQADIDQQHRQFCPADRLRRR
jgi:site-specific recombinase XerD